ncbi:carbohydrate-binding module family 1 protein [Karstenula rhodostoma CBS 690.94]|uniref:pectin lyase n=1 Tax=Karstenula rhodostoma CBS 690.94 TaxID=1392251 RepID=A0A9P4PXA2_9PLEO|nr:carbohydrate-binding module family 1 protein [Karstenula rhodostoma CBS 690.94]
MRYSFAAVVLAASQAAAQSVVGSAYGFANGVTGGGDAKVVTVSSVDELADVLSDDIARTIVIDGELDFTGTSATGAGCDRKSCSANSGGQFYLGDLSCGGDDNVAVSSIKYDAAGPKPLTVGSNKTILGNGKGVLIGKGLELADGASNVIIQGLEFKNINPGVVWGGDALAFKGNNDGVWVDSNKFSLVGRMFIVSHYAPSRLTISNNEFDGTTTTSASCNGNHYWTMMFYGDGDQVTLDKNYYHDVAGRAPKLGEDGTTGTFHAVNNYFSNMKGHAFDTYQGASALIEGNVFEAVSQPNTDKAAGSSTLYTVPDASAASACSSSLGRACEINSVDSSSGKLAALKADSVLSTFSKVKDVLVKPLAASEVAAHVKAHAGPTGLKASSSTPSKVVDDEAATAPAEEVPAATSEAAAPVESEKPATSSPVAAQPVAEPSSPSTGSGSDSSSGTVAAYGQCGGNEFTGATKCVSGYTCTKYNDWYSQCITASAKFRRNFGPFAKKR